MVSSSTDNGPDDGPSNSVQLSYRICFSCVVGLTVKKHFYSVFSQPENCPSVSNYT